MPCSHMSLCDRCAWFARQDKLLIAPDCACWLQQDVFDTCRSTELWSWQWLHTLQLLASTLRMGPSRSAPSDAQAPIASNYLRRHAFRHDNPGRSVTIWQSRRNRNVHTALAAADLRAQRPWILIAVQHGVCQCFGTVNLRIRYDICLVCDRPNAGHGPWCPWHVSHGAAKRGRTNGNCRRNGQATCQYNGILSSFVSFDRACTLVGLESFSSASRGLCYGTRATRCSVRQHNTWMRRRVALHATRQPPISLSNTRALSRFAPGGSWSVVATGDDTRRSVINVTCTALSTQRAPKFCTRASKASI
jgi:hypothetical protein